MIKVIQLNCARSYEWTFAALETGVEPKADVVCLQEPPREIGGSVISHSQFEIRKTKRVWTAIQRGSGLVVDERTDSSRGANNYVIVPDVRKRGEKITRIVNVYDPRDTQSGESQAQEVNWERVILQGRTVLAGDLNAHSSRWDLRCHAQQNATFWEGVIDENGLEIGNDGRSTHCWTRADHEGKSVINLTLANRPIMTWTILADDHATRSDHEVIDKEVDADGQEEADHKRAVGWNLDALTAKDLEPAEKLWRELAKERAHLDAECTEDEVEHETAWCQEAMSSVLNATAKQIGICARSDRW